MGRVWCTGLDIAHLPSTDLAHFNHWTLAAWGISYIQSYILHTVLHRDWDRPYSPNLIEWFLVSSLYLDSWLTLTNLVQSLQEMGPVQGQSFSPTHFMATEAKVCATWAQHWNANMSLTLTVTWFQIDLFTGHTLFMAPSYTNIFMGKLEKELLAQSRKKPTVWWRYIDDVFTL